MNNNLKSLKDRYQREKTRTYDELLHVPLKVYVGQVGHHVGHDLESGVLGLLEALADGPDRVSAVGVAGHVLVDALHSDLQAGAAVGQHLREVALEAVVRPGLDRNPDALRLALLGISAEEKKEIQIERTHETEDYLSCQNMED